MPTKTITTASMTIPTRMSMAITHTVERWLALRDPHLVQFVEVGNELVAIAAHFQTIGFKACLVQTSARIESCQESVGVGDSF